MLSFRSHLEAGDWGAETRATVEPRSRFPSTPARKRLRHGNGPTPSHPTSQTLSRESMKKALVAAVLSLGLFSSCLGPNKLWNKLHDWNLSATENRWANEGIFVALT